MNFKLCILSATLAISIVSSVKVIEIYNENNKFNGAMIEVPLDGGEIKKIKTLERPIITSGNLAKHLKYKFVDLYSYRIEKGVAHIDEYEDLFESTYYEKYRKEQKSIIDDLTAKEVRVVDFMVTRGPVYLGSLPSTIRNWDFYIEGYFAYEGNFSKNTTQFEKVRLKVSVLEAKTTNGNPSGVEIYEITRF